MHGSSGVCTFDSLIGSDQCSGCALSRALATTQRHPVSRAGSAFKKLREQLERCHAKGKNELFRSDYTNTLHRVSRQHKPDKIHDDRRLRPLPRTRQAPVGRRSMGSWDPTATLHRDPPRDPPDDRELLHRPAPATLPSRWRPRRPRGANQEPRSPQDSSHTGQKAASALRYAVTGQRPSAAPLVVCWSGANTAWGTALAPFRRICPCVCHQTAPPPCDVKRHSA